MFHQNGSEGSGHQPRSVARVSSSFLAKVWYNFHHFSSLLYSVSTVNQGAGGCCEQPARRMVEYVHCTVTFCWFLDGKSERRYLKKHPLDKSAPNSGRLGGWPMAQSVVLLVQDRASNQSDGNTSCAFPDHSWVDSLAFCGRTGLRDKW